MSGLWPFEQLDIGRLHETPFPFISNEDILWGNKTTNLTGDYMVINMKMEKYLSISLMKDDKFCFYIDVDGDKFFYYWGTVINIVPIDDEVLIFGANRPIYT